MQRAKRRPPMTPIMRFYFEAWLDQGMLFGHPDDEHYFFLFVRSCIQNSKVGGRNGEWLKGHLMKRKVNDHWVRKAVFLFDTICEYEHSVSVAAFM
jgi:hypothetical protein